MVAAVLTAAAGLLVFQPRDSAAVCHSAYCFSYSEGHEQARWVAYCVEGEKLKGRVPRSNDFRPDPAVSTGSSAPLDYAGSPYDRGHLAPSATFKYSARAMSESFLMSNMSPQRPGLNRGIWLRLEEAERAWARERGRVFVTTGPVLRTGLPAIGRNRVSVPELYYKVVLDPDTPRVNAIGFVIPNRGSKMPLSHFAVSVDSVERLTRIDFFPALPDSLETALEAGRDWLPPPRVRGRSRSRPGGYSPRN